MADEKLISRINELAQKSRTTQLDENELEEQRKLRQDYINAFKRNMKDILDNIEIVDDKNVPS